jgi:YVTN family beta-propeller protein
LTTLFVAALVALQVPSYVSVLAPAIPQAAAAANGDVLTWVAKTNLTSPHWGPTDVATNKFHYVIGGAGFTPNGGGGGAVNDSLNRVDYAPIRPDGSLGAYGPTSALNTPRAEPIAVIASAAIYVIGGFTGGNSTAWTPVASIEKATINVDGTLGAWTTLGKPLTFGRGALGAFVSGSRLYVVGGATVFPQGGTLGTVESIAFADLNGGPGTWRAETPLPATRGAAVTVGIGGRALVTGGFDASGQVTKTIFSAAFDGTGALVWSTSPISMPVLQGIAAHVAAFNNGFLYVSGGIGNQVNRLNWIAVAPDLTLSGAWQQYPSSGLGFGTLSYASMVSVGGHLYYAPINNDYTGTLDITLERDADVGVSISHTPEPVTVGNTATTTVTVHNYGPSGATNVTTMIDPPQSDLPTSVISERGECFRDTAPGTGMGVARSWLVGGAPQNVAVDATLHRAYVTNESSGTVTVIDLRSDVVVATIDVGPRPYGVTVDESTGRVYVSNFGSGANNSPGVGQSVMVIDEATSQVIATIDVGARPRGIVAVPVANRVFVGLYRTNNGADNNKVAVIDTSTNQVTNILTTDFGAGGSGMAADLGMKKVYVPNGSMALTGLSIVDASNLGVNTPTYGMRIGNGAIAAHPSNHRIYLGDTQSTTLDIFDGSTYALRGTMTGVGGSLGLAASPTNGHLYANNGTNVTVVDPGGDFAQIIGSIPTGPSSAMAGIAVDGSTGFIYAIDAAQSKLLRLSDTPPHYVWVCPLGSLAPGAEAKVTLTYAPTTAGSEMTSASVSRLEFDPVTTNNFTTDTLTVIQGLVGIAECRTTSGETVTTRLLPDSTVRLYSGAALVGTTIAAGVDSPVPARYVFTGLAPNARYTVRYSGIALFGEFSLVPTLSTGTFASTISCSVDVLTDANGSGIVPEPTPLLDRLNHLWFRPYHLVPGTQIVDVIPSPGVSTWYRVTVGPHQRLTFRLTNPPTQYTVLAFTDLFAVARQLKQQGTTLAGLRMLTATQDRSAPDLDSPDLDSPDLDSPDLDSPDLDSPDLDSPDLDSPDLDSPDLDSPDLDSPDLDSPDLDSPDLDSNDTTCVNPVPVGFKGCPVPASDLVQTYGSVYVAAQRRGLRAFSAQPGAVPQTIVLNTRDYQGDVYFRVRPHGDLSSSDTFSVTATLEGGAGCTNAPLIARAPLTPTWAPGARTTIVLTNTAGSWFTGQTPAAFTASLQAFANRPEVNGVVVDVKNDANLALNFADWAANPTCVAQANLVARSVKQLIDLYRAHYGIQYLVIAGPDPAIPFFRTRDDAELSKESRYSGGLDALSALETALSEDYVLTDSFYGASGPTTRSGHDVYLADIAIGRLVETPNDITSYLAQYAAAGGRVSVQRALSTGYGFVSDLADYQTGSLKKAGATVDTLNNDTWSADDLRGFLFGAQRYQLFSLQGHGSAERFVPANDGPRILSSEITAVNDGRFAGTFLMSLACHYVGYDLVQAQQLGGANVVSFPQAFLAQGATAVGETGYGYGHYPLLKNGEVLMADLADELSFTADLGGVPYGLGGVPVGKALNIAKLRFLNSLADVRGIEAKVINETVVYGAPMFAVKTPNTFARPVATSVVGALTPLTGTLSSADVTQGFTLTPHTLGLGTFFDAGTLNDTATFPFRPIVPAKSVGVQASAPGGGDVVPRGAVLLSGSYSDTTGFVPALAIPATQNGTTNPPTSYASAAFAPGRLIRLEEFAGDAAIFIPFQFSGTGGPGTARTFSSITAKLYYSTLTGDAALVDAPGIQNVSVTRELDGALNPTGRVRVSVTLSGRSVPEIQDVWETYTATSGALFGSWNSTPLNAGTTTLGRAGTFTRTYTGTIDPLGADPLSVLVDIQAVGGNGLVSYGTNGGAHFRIVEQTATAASPKRTPLIMLGAPSTATYRSRVPVSAVLTDGPTGSPIAGKRVSFKLAGSFASAITGADGVASATLVANAPPHGPGNEPYRIVASVAEDLDMLAGGAETAISITPGPTGIVPATGVVLGYSDNAIVARLVLTSRGTGLPDQRVVIDLGALGKVVTYTDGNGDVRLDTLDFGGLGPGTYAVALSYAGENVAHPELSRLAASSVNVTIAVLPENATLTVNAGPQAANAPVKFGGTIAQQSDGSRGDIGKATVHYVLTNGTGAVAATGFAPVTPNTDGLGGGTWAASLALPPGLYTVAVDASGYYTSAVASLSLPVFDPNGFVTGGGYVTSTSANSSGLALGKKENFGFNLRYGKGATTPSGNLLFQAKESNVDFKATSFDWLVITSLAGGGQQAEFQGVGTVNGSGTWTFHAVVRDAAGTFEIRIKNAVSGVTYFVSSTTSGGNIVIQ